MRVVTARSIDISATFERMPLRCIGLRTMILLSYKRNEMLLKLMKVIVLGCKSVEICNVRKKE